MKKLEYTAPTIKCYTMTLHSFMGDGGSPSTDAEGEDIENPNLDNDPFGVKKERNDFGGSGFSGDSWK